MSDPCLLLYQHEISLIPFCLDCRLPLRLWYLVIYSSHAFVLHIFTADLRVTIVICPSHPVHRLPRHGRINTEGPLSTLDSDRRANSWLRSTNRSQDHAKYSQTDSGRRR